MCQACDRSVRPVTVQPHLIEQVAGKFKRLSIESVIRYYRRSDVVCGRSPNFKSVKPLKHQLTGVTAR